MGLIHTPRMLVSIGRGLLKRRRSPTVVGLGEENPHICNARLSLFDVDYLGHMNNAAYLSHGEYARWEMCGHNGMLSSMYEHNVFFVVAGTTVRFRREIRPVFSKFQIETSVFGLDARNIWISHKFRTPAAARSPDSSRVMAQIIVQGVALKGRDIIDPSTFLKSCVGMDAGLIDNLVLPSTKLGGLGISEDIMERYMALDDSLKKAAAEDDENQMKLNEYAWDATRMRR